MAYIPLFLHPGTPLEKEVDLEHAREWVKAGVIPDNTPCARISGGVAIPLCDMLRATDIGRAVLPLSESGEPQEALRPTGGARLHLSGHPNRHNTDPLFPDEREYLIANRLVSPRYVDDVTHTQAVIMIRRHRLTSTLWAVLKGSVAVAVIGASAYGVKFYLDGRQSQTPSATAVVTPALKTMPPQAVADTNPSTSAAPKDPPKPRLTRAQEREMRRAAAAIKPSDAWTLEKFGGSVGVLFDKAQGNVVSGRCGGAFLAERDGNVYVFTALSALTSAQLPTVTMLDGRVIEISSLPMYVFGDKDTVAFLLGRSSGGVKADDDDTPDGLPIASAEPKAAQIEVCLLEQADSSLPMLNKRLHMISRNDDGSYTFRRDTSNLQLGCPLLTGDANVAACVGRKPNEISEKRMTVLILASLPAAMPVQWEVYVRERDACRRMEIRTDSFQRLVAHDFTLQNLPDRTLLSLLRATSQKANEAAARYTESLRDTTKLQENFKNQMRQIAQADVIRFTIPYFIAQADAHVLARQKALQSIDLEFTPNYLASLR